MAIPMRLDLFVIVLLIVAVLADLTFLDGKYTAAIVRDGKILLDGFWAMMSNIVHHMFNR